MHHKTHVGYFALPAIMAVVTITGMDNGISIGRFVQRE
jgi:hypothetical protein